MGKSVRIISWNVNGIRAMVTKGLYDIVKEMDPDIFCVQETKAPEEIIQDISKEMIGYKAYSNSAVKKGYSGTAIFTRINPLSQSNGIGTDEHDQEGRIVTVEYDKFYLVNAYIPNSGMGLKRLDYRKVWDKALLEFLKELDRKKPVIFTGDFNVAHEPIDLARPKQNYNKTAGYSQTEIDGFKNLLNAGFIDTFRSLNKDVVQYTFWNQRFNARATNVGWRIDYFLVSKALIGQVKSSFMMGDIMGSDHCPVGLEIEI